MTKRPDHEFILSLINDKVLSIREAKLWMALPYFILPDTRNRSADSTGEAKEFQEFYLREVEPFMDPIEEAWRCEILFQMSDYYFHEFVVHDAYSPFRFSVTARNTIRVTMLMSDNVREHGPLMFDLVLKQDNTDPAKTRIQVNPLSQLAKKVSAGTDKSVKDYLIKLGVERLAILHVFKEFNNQKDRYLIKVERQNPLPTLPGDSVEETLIKSYGPKVVYLNAPSKSALTVSEGPVVNCQQQVGEEFVPRQLMAGHLRRGHWKTLRALRFQRHPKYLVKNGIYVKPAWVGPKVIVSEGKIYTILE